jgi:hypothetical protein
VLEMLLGSIMITIKEVDNVNGMKIGAKKLTM